MKLTRFLALLASCSLTPVLACGGPVEEDASATTTASLQAVPNGLPGGGGGFHWCCFHPPSAGGGAWQAGEIATDGTVVTGANAADLCARGVLPVRQRCG